MSTYGPVSIWKDYKMNLNVAETGLAFGPALPAKRSYPSMYVYRWSTDRNTLQRKLWHKQFDIRTKVLKEVFFITKRKVWVPAKIRVVKIHRRVEKKALRPYKGSNPKILAARLNRKQFSVVTEKRTLVIPGRWKFIKVKASRYKLITKKVRSPMPTTGLLVNDLQFKITFIKQLDEGSVYGFKIHDETKQIVTTYKMSGQIGLGLKSDYWPGYPAFNKPQSHFFPSENWPDSSDNPNSEEGLKKTELINRNVAKLMDKIKNQEINLQNNVAEGAQLRATFANVASRIAKCLLAIKAGNLLNAAKIIFSTKSKDLASDYLMWTYGISPLLQDLDGMMKHLASLNRTKEQTFSAKAVWKFPDSVIDWTPTGPYDGDIFRYSQVRRESTTMTVKSVVTCATDDPDRAELAQLGFTNPAATAWELVPFSFVVDWLIPIGAALNRLDSLVGRSVKSYHTTVVVKRTTVIESICGEANSPVRSNHYYVWPNRQSFKMIQESVYVKRELKTFPSTPPLPIIKDPFSRKHVANAIALLVQLKK